MKFYDNDENKKYSPLNQALKECLPELMLRNIKKGKRLNSKMDVSFLLNNIELRNQSYLKKLVSSSEKTLQNIKSGLDLKSAMKLSEEKLSPLNYQILEDYFLRKHNVIANTKKNLPKNTEEESNAIIKNSLRLIKHILYPSTKILEEPELEIPQKKLMNKSELIEAENFIKKKLENEHNNLNTRVNKYLARVGKIKLTAPKDNKIYDPKWIKINRDKNKDFYLYADNVFLDNNNIKMIHYKKLEPIPIRDKSCPNLKDINERLFPEIKKGIKSKDNFLNIKNCNSVKIINGLQFKNKTKEKENKNINDIKVNYNKKDSYNTLNRLVIRNKSLLNMSNKRYRKLSSLMDIELPKLSDYDLIITKKKKINLPNNEKENYNTDNISLINELRNKYKNWKLIPELDNIKEEIKTLRSQQINVEENYRRHKEEIYNKTYLIPDIPVRKKDKRDSFKSTNDEGLFNLNLNINMKNINKNSLSSVETPSLRMPSSYSVQILKRKSRINSGIYELMQRKKKRDFSNISRDKTNVSSILQSIRNSATTSMTSNKKEEGKFIEIFRNKIKKDGQKQIIGKPLFSLKKIRINLFNNSKNNNSSVLSNVSN